jgi:hypothetical protein
MNKHYMITDFIKGAAEQIDNNSIQATRQNFEIEKGEGAIRIRHKNRPERPIQTDIYDRARMIFSRARRTTASRPSAIF